MAPAKAQDDDDNDEKDPEFGPISFCFEEQKDKVLRHHA